MRGQLKLNRKGFYKGSNVTFNPVTCEARSYDWWIFVSKINGLVVFNNYSYSSTTCRHQSKVRSLLSDLGVNVDVTIEAPEGLQRLNLAERYYSQRIASLETAMSNKGTHKAKNLERLQTQQEYRAKLAQVQVLKGGK